MSLFKVKGILWMILALGLIGTVLNLRGMTTC